MAHEDMVMSISQPVVTFVLLPWLWVTNGMPDPTWRDMLIRQEASRHTGGQVTLTTAEQKLDTYLHRLMEQEMSAAQFLPAIHFFKAKPLIQKSSIFKLLQKMPKGDVAGMAMLGTHPDCFPQCCSCVSKSCNIHLKYRNKLSVNVTIATESAS